MEDSAASEMEAAIRDLTGCRSAETTEGFIGSRPYANPEQRADAARAGSAADVYSLGASLYHLLSGQPPALDAATEPPHRPLPRELRAICARARADDPADRYDTPLDLADDIERYLRDEAVMACPEPLGTRLRRWLKRHVTVVVATAAAGFVALLAFGLAAVALEQHRSARVQAEHALAERDLRHSLALAEQKLRQARQDAEWRADMERSVARTQLTFRRKDAPLFHWQDVVGQEGRELVPKPLAKARDPATSLETLAAIAEAQLALAHMAGQAGDWQTAHALYEKAIPFFEELLPRLEVHSKDETAQEAVLFHPWMLPIARNNAAVALWMSGQRKEGLGRLKENRDKFTGLQGTWWNIEAEVNFTGLGPRADTASYYRILSDANVGVALRTSEAGEARTRLAGASAALTEFVTEWPDSQPPRLARISISIRYARLLAAQHEREPARKVLAEALEDASRLLRNAGFGNAPRLPDGWENLRNHLHNAGLHLERKEAAAFETELARAADLNESARLRHPDEGFSRTALLSRFWLLP